MPFEPMTAADAAAIEAQLGRPPRGVAGVAWRCPCGKPGVVATEPRLPDGTPYSANDPELLTFVHVAEVVSFLAAHRRYRDPDYPAAMEAIPRLASGRIDNLALAEMGRAMAGLWAAAWFMNQIGLQRLFSKRCQL